MTIASEITRLQGLKSRIRTKLIALGLVNSNTASLSDCTTAVEGITGTQSITDASTQYNVAGKQYAQVSSQTLVPSNIVSGVNILGVVGTAAVNPPAANLQAGAVYYGGANAPASLYPSSGYDGFSQVIVELTDANRMLTASNVKSGVTIMGVTGTYETTTEAKAPTLSELKTAGITSQSVVITPSTSGRHLSQVTVPRITSDIDSNIVASNIKSGVSILGVSGTYNGSLGYGNPSVTLNSIRNLSFPVNFTNTDQIVYIYIMVGETSLYMGETIRVNVARIANNQWMSMSDYIEENSSQLGHSTPTFSVSNGVCTISIPSNSPSTFVTTHSYFCWYCYIP